MGDHVPLAVGLRRRPAGAGRRGRARPLRAPLAAALRRARARAATARGRSGSTSGRWSPSGSCSAQPRRSRSSPRSGRRTGGTDAEAIVVFDISRSMLARTGPSGADAARARARRRQAAARGAGGGAVRRLVAHRPPAPSPLPDDERDGVHLDRRPSDRDRATATRAPGIARHGVRRAGRPRPAELLRTDCEDRVALVLTDGESIPFNLGELRAPLVAGRVSLLLRAPLGPRRARLRRAAGSRSATGRARRAAPCSTGSPVRSAAACSPREVERRSRRSTRSSAPVRSRPRGRELKAVPLAPYTAAAALRTAGAAPLRRNF